MGVAMLSFTSRTRSRSNTLAGVILAAIAIGVLTDAASAGRVLLSGTHSRSSIKAACDSAGGVYISGSGGYSCHTAGGSVQCNTGDKGKCYGDCGNCGATASGGRGTVIGTLRPPEGGVTLKPGNNPPPKQTAGPVRVKPPVAVSNPGGAPNNGGPHHGTNQR